jgi:hypothetical protein
LKQKREASRKWIKTTAPWKRTAVTSSVVDIDEEVFSPLILTQKSSPLAFNQHSLWIEAQTVSILFAAL